MCPDRATMQLQVKSEEEEDNEEIYNKMQKIAEHERCYDKEEIIYNPLHYLRILERKPGALDQAAPLAHWELPACFSRIRKVLEVRLGKKGKREYIQVLRLMEQFSMIEVQIAIEEALNIGAISFDAVKSLLLCLLEKKIPKLDLKRYPHIPTVDVQETAASEYTCLCQRMVKS